MNTLKNLLSLNDDERLLAEVRTYQEKLISNAEEPIWERKWLTIEEAAAYSGIGRTKLRELSNQAGCPFAIYVLAYTTIALHHLHHILHHLPAK